MNRLSLADLKAQKNNVVANLEAIKGGNLSMCHCGVTNADVIVNGPPVVIPKCPKQ